MRAVLLNPQSGTPEVQVPLVHRAELIKYQPDETSPWWRRAWFKFAHAPFVWFSFTVMGVPAITAIEPEAAHCSNCGARVPGPRFSWVEDEGTFDSEGVAERTCQNGFWRVVPSPYNCRVPAASFQLRKGSYYPLADNPDKYLTPVTELTVAPRKAIRVIDDVKEGLERLTAILTVDARPDSR